MSSNIRVNSITPSVGNSVAIGTAGGSVVFQCDTINFSGTSGVTNFTEDISVDGHTELDNVNISGVVTATSFAGPLTGNVTGNVSGNLTGNVTGNTSGTAGGLSGSPSITVADITASGNVSIAGTLTYEDVTNVDSIGIVTAKSGIHVTGGSVGIGTNNPSGKLEVAGDAVISHTGANPLDLYKYGTAAPTILMYGANGTAASPTQTLTGDVIGGFNAFGYGSSGFAGGPSVRITAVATENNGQTSNRGADIKIETVTTGGTSLQERLRITGIGSVGISSATPKTDVDISQKTGAVALPQGTTAQRPTGSAPYIRKNSTNNALEFYNGTNWVEIITDYFPTGSTTLG